MNPSKEEAQRINQQRLEELQKQVSNAVEQMHAPAAWKGWLDFAAKVPQYSFNNQLALLTQAEQRGTQPRVFASFKRWKDLGYPVIKGEHSYRIFGPVLYKRPFDRETGKQIDLDDVKNRDKSTVQWKRTVVGFKPVPTFEIGQTEAGQLAIDSIPEELRPKILNGPAPEGMWDALVTYAKSLGVTVTLVPHEKLGRANGVARFSVKEQRPFAIEVSEALDDAARVKTLVHECAHATMHGGNQHADTFIKEIEAESVAYIVSARYGLDTSEYSFNYVGGWAAYDAEKVRETGERVVETARTILEATSPTEENSAETTAAVEHVAKRIEALSPPTQDVRDFAHGQTLLTPPDGRAPHGSMTEATFDARTELMNHINEQVHSRQGGKVEPEQDTTDDRASASTIEL